MDERTDELFEQRRAKAERLRALGADPYPIRAHGTHTAAQALAQFERNEGGGEQTSGDVSVCGRLRPLRIMGKKAIFAHLEDSTGEIQAYFKRDLLGETGWAVLEQLEFGDFVQVQGPLFRTRMGEITIEARALTVLAKALRPPPEKWHAISDVELKYRQRYLDLMSSAEVRRRFQRRSQIVAAIRRFMDGRGFIEVETPVLQSEAGGAAARPFTTFFNALDEQRYLRISLELHLKRLLVGGLDRVYEIGRIFRNEGVDALHNPEFTMMESYQAYADYQEVAEMVEQLVATVAQQVLGTTVVPHGESTLDLTPPWQRITMRNALIEFARLDFEAYRDEAALRRWMAERRLHAAPEAGWGKLIDEVFSELVQPHLQQPVFVLDYPVELSPLAKRKPDDPGLVERFEPFVGGFEIGNAYSELNDPIDQRERFVAQIAARTRGDDEAELMDEDFLTALEHGMPPAGGLGLGIDRLVMILLNEPTIREVLLFPALRTKRIAAGGVESAERFGTATISQPMPPSAPTDGA
ncbi:MAG TPA: lysine--tRNA ligase [Dehalococcoidia bacterium]|nr:lysine--tRNA ligase [Dehalococcoidia bacterium]